MTPDTVSDQENPGSVETAKSVARAEDVTADRTRSWIRRVVRVAEVSSAAMGGSIGATVESVRGRTGSRPAWSPPLQRSPESFHALQAWDGVVSEVFSTYFVARIIDKRSGDEEEAEIPISEISPEDRRSLEVGRQFYWTIGYHRSRSGQQTRQSVMLFRRHGVQRRRQVAAVDAWIDEVSGSWLNQS